MKAVLFDLDGTLFDTAPEFILALNQLRQQYRLPPLPEGDIRAVISNGAPAMIKLAFNKERGEPEFDVILQAFLDLYLLHLATNTTPFPGIEALLQQLAQAGIAWGVVTNKPAVYTLPLMRAFPHLPAPGTIVCPDHVRNRKPDPESILLACRQLDCTPREAIYIGDHERDISAGRAAGVPTIACTYGYINSDDDPLSWRADHTVACATDIWPLLKQNYLFSAQQP